MASTIRQRLRRFNGTDYDTIHLETETKAITDYPYPSNPNLLDNWYFAGGGSQQGGGQFPINQRGQTSYSRTGYTIDRWPCNNYNDYGTVTVNSDGIKLTHPDNGGHINFFQITEHVDLIYGKTVTLSALVDGELYSNTFTVGSTGSVAFGNLTMHRNNPGSTATSGLIFILRAHNTTGATIQAAKLELGDTQTLAHQDSNGIWVLNEIPNYQEQLFRCQTSTADTSDNYANKTNVVDNYYVRPNLLDNWYFVGGGSQQGGGQFPINQRGQTSYPTGYTIDRWQSMVATTTVALTSESLQLTDSGNNWLLLQSMENVLAPGKTYTLSALYKAANSRIRLVASWGLGQYFFNLESPVSSTYRLATITGTIPENATIDYEQVVVQALDANCVIDLQAIKLELGDTQTLAHQENGVWVLNEIPNYQEQLARCQRYYTVFEGDVSGIRYQDQATVMTFIPTPVTMRSNPTITKLNSDGVLLYYGDGYLDVVTEPNLEAYMTVPSGIQVRCSTNKPSGNQNCVAQIPKIALDANL